MALSDRTKKQIILDRAEGLSLRSIAAKHNTSMTTVKRVCDADPETTRRVAAKKEQNTLDMLEFMDQQKQNAQDFILLALNAIKDPDKMKKASAQSIAVAMGIVIDKFTTTAPVKTDEGVKVVIDV